ncbi:MAG: acyltransferase [Chitinophagaceae bacterium]|nr:acyltransferase [Chitinophagaceae bacterium]
MRSYGLDVARCLAITFVVGVHTVSHLHTKEIVYAWYLANLGVDLFFALSGFLIGGIIIDLLEKGQGTLTPGAAFFFLMRRWFRTLPLYFVILFVNILLGKYLYRNLDDFPMQYLIFTQFFTSPESTFFGESWSLCVEEWFYLSFAVLLCTFSVMNNQRTSSLRAKLLAFTCSYILVITVVRLYWSNHNFGVFITTLYRLDAIAYGVLSVILFRCYNVQSKRKLLALLSIVLVAAGSFLYIQKYEVGNFHIIAYSCSGLGLALMVGLFQIYETKLKRITPNRLIIFISKISYSLYLSNVLILGLMSHFLYQYQGTIVEFLLAVSVTLGVSTFTYKFIEMPFIRYRDKILPRVVDAPVHNLA